MSKRYNADWLREKIEAGWSTADMAFADNCALGTIAYHVDEYTEYDSDEIASGLCVRFRAEREREWERQRRVRDAHKHKRRVKENKSPETGETKLGDFA